MGGITVDAPIGVRLTRLIVMWRGVAWRLHGAMHSFQERINEETADISQHIRHFHYPVVMDRPGAGDCRFGLTLEHKIQFIQGVLSQNTEE